MGEMHEFSTMESILKSVLKVAEEHGAEEILGIELRVGELTFLNPEQLRFAFQVLSEGTKAEGAKLKIRRVKPEIRCHKCGYEGPIRYEGPEYHVLSVAPLLSCPNCGDVDVELKAGRECIIQSVRIKVPKRT